MNSASFIPLIIILAISAMGMVNTGKSSNLPPGDPLNAADVAWMLTASALVLLMTPGLSYFYGGMVSRRNVVSTMLQSVIALGLISLLWVVVGFGLAFGSDIGGWGIVGNPLDFFMFHGVNGEPVALGRDAGLKLSIPLSLFAMFQLKFAIITPALITGSFAERVRFSAYLLFMVFFSLLIYCPLAHMTWHPDGLLYGWGVKDFAGGTVVHMSAGWAALAGALFLGQRVSHRGGTAHEPANIPFVLLGTGLLWFGWFGFNAGSALRADSTAAMAFATTNTASASAMLAWIFLDWAMGRKPSALGACIGAVVGLVAVTPAAGFITVAQSMFIGTVSSLISNVAVQIRTKTKLDDTLDVFPCHGIGGLSGMAFTAIFAALPPEGPLSRLELIAVHAVAMVFVSAIAFCGSWLLYKLTDTIIPLRVNLEQESEGLDWSQHGEDAMSFVLVPPGRSTATKSQPSSPALLAMPERELARN